MPDLKDFAVKALNITDEQFAEIVYSDDKGTMKENAIDELLRLDAERVAKLKSSNKEELTKMHDKGHQKGLAEGLSKFEGSLKEQFGVETNLQGVDLVKEIIAKIGKDTNLDDEKVKLHPLYLALERKVGTDYIERAEYEKVKGEFDGYKSNIEKEKITGVVSVDAIKFFRSLNPVLSKNQTIAFNQEADFVAKLKAFEYEVQPDGNHVVKIDGKRLENAQGHPVLFNDFVKQQAEKYFDFEVQGQKGSAGNNNNGGSGGASKSFAFKTKEEYIKAQASESDPQVKIAMMHFWNEINK